jgi:transposase
MIDYQTFSQIKQYQQEGLTASQIGHKLSLDRRTVNYWLGESRYRQRKKQQRPSKLDPYKENIKRLLEKHPYSAAQLYQRLCDEGFNGSYTLVKDYVRLVRPKRQPAFLSLHFAPGDYAQVDWGIHKTIGVGENKRRLNFFVMVLCYSRMMYVQFSLSQSMEHFLDCHLNAFRYFGHVPRHVMIDNLKTGVLKRSRLGGEITLNPKYADFANHYGFAIKPCGVAKGNEKGRVENAVGYVKKNFLSGLNITQFDALNPAISRWQDEIANVRIHKTTRKRPVDLFDEDKTAMLPINPNNYDIARIETLRANKLFRITLDTNRYSVPAEYAGWPLIVKIYPERLCIYHQEKLIARHDRRYTRHQDYEHPDHPKELLAQRRRAQEQKNLQQLMAISPKAGDYYRQLQNRRLNAPHHVRKIVALAEIYNQQDIARALEDALHFEAFSSEYVINLLEQQQNKLPEPSPLHLTRPDDVLDIELTKADMSIYTQDNPNNKPDKKENTDEGENTHD